jgi:hypothetical protein
MFPEDIHFKLSTIFPLSAWQSWVAFPKFDEQYMKDVWPRRKPLTPTEITSMPIINTLDGTNTYTYDGTPYQFEYLFAPNMVFYIYESDMKTTLDHMKLLFSDNDQTLNEYRMDGYYPRFNIKINKMIFVGIGEGANKVDLGYEDHLPCSMVSGHFVCRGPIQTQYQIPIEYKQIQESCVAQASKQACLSQNKLSKQVSNHDLCKWVEHEQKKSWEDEEMDFSASPVYSKCEINNICTSIYSVKLCKICYIIISYYI